MKEKGRKYPPCAHSVRKGKDKRTIGTVSEKNSGRERIKESINHGPLHSTTGGLGGKEELERGREGPKEPRRNGRGGVHERNAHASSAGAKEWNSPRIE